MQSKLVARTPQVDRDPLEELRDRPLAHPDEQSIEDTCSQHELRTHFAMPNLFFCVVDADSGDIVSAIDQNYVHKAHACKQWDQGEEHDPVFAKQLVASDLSASQSRENDDSGEACCPPAVEQCRVVCKASASIWRSVGPYGTLLKSGSRHGGEGTGASSGQRPSSK